LSAPTISGFFDRSTNGDAKWVVTGKTDNGLLRRKWWDAQCKKRGFKIEPGCYTRIAVAVHPTKTYMSDMWKSINYR